MSIELARIGWTAARASAFEPLAARGLVPGRVVAVDRGRCRVATAAGERDAEPTGRLRHTAAPGELPVTGDWIALERGRIAAVLPRAGRLSRKTAGERTAEQIVAANVDVVFVVGGLDGDFNPWRLERALVAAREGGARAVVVLTKADLRPDPDARRAVIEQLVPDVPTLVVSALSGAGLDALRIHLVPGETVALLGSSGTGKSTLVNRLLGHERQSTQPVRAGDDRGRHTTTRRELFALPGGALILDTPGLRELQLWGDEADLGAAFGDVEAIAADCGFRDCRHGTEPRCAVRRAVEDGRLAAARLESFFKLRRELRHLALRQDELARTEERRKLKSLWRAARDHKPRR